MSSSPTPPLPPRLFYHPAFWCHNCDMSIALPPSPTPTALLCPHCHRDSLEQMDHHHNHHHHQNDGNTLTAIDDNFLLSSPYLHRLIDHLTAANDDVPAPIITTNPRSEPVPKVVIDSLPVVNFNAESDLSLCCAVCKDQFVVDSVGKVMPCKHVYHSDCIVPWLEINNSCPVCRFKLPVLEEEKERKESGGGGGSSREEELGFDELMEDEVELFGFRNTLRRIARSHRRWDEEGTIGGGSEGELFSPTQIGEVERGGGVLERQNSVETVSSWPRWQVDEGVGGGGGGGVDDDGDALHRM